MICVAALMQAVVVVTVVVQDVYSFWAIHI